MIINPTFRYQNKPVVPAPLHIRSCGHYWIAEKSWEDRKMTKNFLQLFWGIRGKALLRCGGKDMILEAEKVCFYFPGDRHDVSLLESPLEYCWVTIDGDNVEELIRNFQLTRDLRTAGKCPTELFESINIHLHDYSAKGEYLASADGYKVLCLALAGKEVDNTLAQRFKTVVSENIADTALKPAQIAGILGVHPTTLTRNIHAATGMNPGEYITALRMQMVLAMIRTSHASFKEIAEETGFANANYLAKVFRKKFGCSPSEFRESGEQ
ncbi:MAG: AraC family transcriptional regulator [Lentisphaeria bacterium]|nr:AraC family transcriptional regulator [Lentisphaeria bacterium]